MARRKGWLVRISPRMLGDRMAYVFDLYCDLVEAASSRDPLVRRYLPIGAVTCIEMLYRQAGLRWFDPRTSMHTPVSIVITPAEMNELVRTIALLGPADLFWHNKGIQSVNDIMSVLDELKMPSVFKGDQGLLGFCSKFDSQAAP